MNNVKQWCLLLGVFLATAITSCNHEPDEPDNVPQSHKDDYISLGKKLDNPYTVANMRLALENIKKRKASVTSRDEPVLMDPGFDIDPTHLYVEFQPRTEEEEALLKQDSSLVLFDYPLDYEFTDETLNTRPALPDGEFPSYYAAIRIDSEAASEAHYRMLEELYIPEEDPYFEDLAPAPEAGKLSGKKESLLNELLNEAYQLTGNEREAADTDTASRIIFGRRWWPSGTIMVFDEIAGRNVPVQGAQVLIRQWFTVRQGITDGNGYFRTSSVRGSARYILQWERYHYSIRNGSLFQAETRGPNERDRPWNLAITGGDDKYHALIHQAAHDYYYGHRFGLGSPPMNNEGRQVKIAARELRGRSSAVKAREIWFGAYISLREWGAASEKVYGTTIHELAHAAHRRLATGSYNNIVFDAYTNPCASGCNDLGPISDNNRRLLETWPTTVEILFVLDRYKNKFGITNYSVYERNLQFENLQLQTIGAERHYTSVGYDLMDNLNQREFYNNYNLPVDRVSGYTIQQLENALIGARSWWQWRDNLKNRFDNPTERYLDELFNNWEIQ
ncbi:MAG TPA: hypothetical protein VF677_13890 [Flavobacterium sp.]|jgi:hypothetical protein